MAVYSKISNSRDVRNGGSSILSGKTVTSNTRTVPSAVKTFYEPDSYRYEDTNLDITSASEGSIRIPDGTTFIEFQARTAVDVRWSFVQGRAQASTSPYFTLKAGGSYFMEYPSNGMFGDTIYFATASNVTIEFRARVGNERS